MALKRVALEIGNGTEKRGGDYTKEFVRYRNIRVKTLD